MNFITCFIARYKAEEEKAKEAEEKTKDILEIIQDKFVNGTKPNNQAKKPIDILVVETIDEIEPIEEDIASQEPINETDNINPFESETPNR